IGQNPPSGAAIYYYLKNKPSGEVKLEILDGAGKVIKTFTGRSGSEAGQTPAAQGGQFGGGGASRVPAEAGLNRFIWDLRYPDASRFPGLIMWQGSTQGPRAVPGTYQVRLTVDGKTRTQSFMVKKDPRIPTTDAEFAKQFDLLIKIRDKVSETHDSIIQIRDVRKQVEEVAARSRDNRAIADAAKSLSAKLTAVEEELYQTKNQSNQDPLNYPIKLNNKLAALTGVVASADAPPTEQAYAVYEDLVAKINVQLQKLADILRTDLPAFNKLVRDQNVPPVIVKGKAATR
ncbi:MAG TPA: glycosyl hydrolase, partial [Blastocatellia bacterium]|nr:glycosyl hydrolase [Blastocatellia bacterium]